MLKLQSLTQHTERLQKLRTVRLGLSASETTRYEVEAIEPGNKNILMKLSSVDDRTSAEALRGNFVFVGEDQVQQPDPGSYFVHDLIGCAVVSADGRSIGVINEIYQLSGNDLWEVRDGVRSFMIPAVKEFIRNVDLKERTVVIELIEGLTGGVDGAE